MLKSLIDKLFGKSTNNINNNKPQVPAGFRERARNSIFVNRYAGVIYFLITWHAFGYFLTDLIKNQAKKEGLISFFNLN